MPSFEGSKTVLQTGPMIDAIKPIGDNVFIYFKYEYTKADYWVLLPAVRGRATCDGEVIATAYREEDLRHPGSTLPENYTYAFLGRDYYLLFKIPQNKSGARRTITFEYQYQTNNILDKWSDWLRIGTIDQAYQVLY